MAVLTGAQASLGALDKHGRIKFLRRNKLEVG